MSDDIQEYESRFIRLCSDVILEKADYAIACTRRKHNNAHTKISRIVKDVCNCPYEAERFFIDLMQNEDLKVKLIAAGYALSNNICSESARSILSALATDTDENIAFHASMSIFVWEHRSENSKVN